MATVPVARRRKGPAAVPDAPRVSAEAYGAGIGRAQRGLADDLGRVGASLLAASGEERAQTARRRELEIAQATRKAQSEFGALRSRAAVDGYPGYLERLKEIEAKATEGIDDPKLKESIALSARARVGSAEDYGFRHHDAERKNNGQELAQARIEWAREEVALNPADEALRRAAEGTIIAEVAERARIAGWDEETHKVERRKALSAARADAVAKRAGADLGGALALYQAQREEMLDADRIAAEKALVAAQEAYARERYGADPEALGRALSPGKQPTLLDSAGASLSGRGAPTAANRAYMAELHKQAVAAAPTYSAETDARFPNIPLEKFKVGDKLVIDGEFAERLDQALAAIAQRGGRLEFADYNMSNALGYRLEKGGVTPGVLLNTPHLLGRAADIKIDGLDPEVVAAIGRAFGLTVVSPKDYKRRGANLGHFDFSLTDQGAAQLEPIKVADRTGGAADPLLRGLPEGRRAKLLSEAVRAQEAAAKAARNAALNTVYDRVEAGDVAGPQDLTAEERAALGPAGLDKVDDYLKGRVTTNEGDYFDLLDMARKRPGEFAEVDLLALRGDIDKGDLEKLMKMQSAIAGGGSAFGGGGGGGKAKRLDMDRVMKDAAPILQRHGVFPPTRNSGNTERSRYYRLFTAIAERSAEHFEQTGGPPDEETARGFARDLMRNRTIEGWLWDSEEPLVEMEIDDIPDGLRARIEAVLEETGEPFTDDDVVGAYMALRARRPVGDERD